VLAHEQTVEPDELITWTQERVGKHKYPRSVVIRDSLPMGPSGKVLKRVIVEEWD
jgi:long-chain acyl-CoA synthetase